MFDVALQLRHSNKYIGAGDHRSGWIAPTIGNALAVSDFDADLLIPGRFKSRVKRSGVAPPADESAGYKNQARFNGLGNSGARTGSCSALVMHYDS